MCVQRKEKGYFKKLEKGRSLRSNCSKIIKNRSEPMHIFKSSENANP